MKRKFLTLGIALAMVATLVVPSVVLADNPTVGITVSAMTISITNSKASWSIGAVKINDVKYFSIDNTQNDTWSQIENTGNTAVDIQIQGTDIAGGSYGWTLAAAKGDKIYALHANSEGTPAVYDVVVKNDEFVDLTTNLTAGDFYDWSMMFEAPSAFDANDDGQSKSATVTLVAREQGT